MKGNMIRIFYGLWLVFLLECWRLSAFNLDTENYLRKNGDPGSLFGFSVAMHRQLKPQDKRILLVGAPKARSVPGQTSKVTGGLYNCDLSATSNTCNRVTLDNDEDLKRESKENQWLGVTVSSQGPGGKVLTCAHRYQRRAYMGTTLESRDIIGRCYVLSEDLTIDPLSDEDGGNWQFCGGRPRGHALFGTCQQGLSATFTKDYHYLIFGAPGAYYWKGVVRLEQKNSTLLDLGIFGDGPYELGGENTLDPNLIPVPSDSYVGFSLDSGKQLTTQGQLTVVAGAPRANYSGAVLLLKKGGDKSNILLTEHILEGEGLASSFGYDLTVLDLNNDGWEDIVVGAPQYFEKEKRIGGAVYVYVNKGGAWDSVKPIKIDGPEDSMFGLAVEHLGDINQDGYHDFAVGAPYDAKGAGNVYIYHGSAAGINSKKAVQLLLGQPLGMKLFGYSLAGNMDVDRNSYPDLAVGSLSDSVFVYRSRPVVSINKEITITPKQIDLTKQNCGTSFCFDLEACFTYTAKAYTPSITVAYAIEAEAERLKSNLPSRVSFIPHTSERESESKGTLTLTKQGTKQCINQKLMLKDNIRDKLRGIPIDVSVNIKNPNRARRQSSSPPLQPVLDANEPVTTHAEIQFLKEGCGSDNVCQSKLKLKYVFCATTTNKDVFIPLELDGDLPQVSLSDQKDIALEVTVTNLGGDDAYEAYVVARFPPSLSYSAVRLGPNSDKIVTCTPNANGSQADCDIGNPFKRDSQVTFYIILSTARITLDTTELEVDLQPRTTSEQQEIAPIKARAKVVIELQLSISGQAQPSQLDFTGEVKGESAMTTESDIGSAIRYQFRIINLGKRLSTFGNASLVINWPKETQESKWLLYLMKISTAGIDHNSCSPSKEINYLKLKSEPSNNRKRRAIGDRNKNEEGTIGLLTDKRKYTTLSCDNGANCVTFRCPLRGLETNAVVTFHARLWNGTFLEEFSKLNYVDLIVNAALHVDGTAKNIVLRNSETQVRVTVFPERRAAHYGGLPWWVILVAILLGLLLLGLLVFLLWKCGFFKRAKYEDSVPSYNAVRITKEERNAKPGYQNCENLEKKPWITSWHDNKHYS